MDNPIFLSDIITTANGIIVTTKLHKREDDIEKNNSEFEKLPGQGHPFGLFILKAREQLMRIFEHRKVCCNRFFFVSY